MRAASALLIAIATLLSAGSASGFTCVQRDPSVLAREAQVVISGVIEAESMFGIRVRVDRVYLGKAEQTITVLPGQRIANRVGGPWTFYLRHDVIAYTHTDCGGSHPSSLTPEERAFFGAGSAPTPDQQLFGPTGNTVAGLGALAAILLLMSRRRGRRPPLTPAGAHP
ncbi:MAG TPA: hypothetical protein VFQ66_00300 [Candidatus Limnocylindria bacterium]|nr:hypothetical protein [Candidatus Limnocylindria bacterium]